jgi:hypothetical protein
VSLSGIVEFTTGQSLTAPVEYDDREAAFEQLADGFEIFFDEFRAADANENGSERVAIWMPARHAQGHAVDRPQRRDDAAGRRRVVRRDDNVHESRRSALTP